MLGLKLSAASVFAATAAEEKEKALKEAIFRQRWPRWQGGLPVPIN